MGATGGFEKFFGNTQAMGLKNIYAVSSVGEVAFAAKDNDNKHWIIRPDKNGKVIEPRTKVAGKVKRVYRLD